jgi:CheY-like chemotaxis protein
MKQVAVLVIEHEWRMRKLVRANLEVLGLTVWEAVSGKHALEILHERRPDLIMVDCPLPDIGVVHLLRAVSGYEAKQMPRIIVMSSEPAECRDFESDTNTGFLMKPFSAMALLSEVQRSLDEPLQANYGDPSEAPTE